MHPIALSLAALPLVSLLSLGCASSPPPATTIPENHLSARGERHLAREDERAASVLERQATMSEDVRCGPLVQSEPGTICWSAPRGSADAERDRVRATQLRHAAVEHRRVSTALRDAEATACAGIAEADIVESPFAHRDDIVAVDLVEGPAPPDGLPRVLGARVRFHRIEKLSPEWLQHVIDCHIARDDALGHDVPEMSYDPLVPRGARATVIGVPHGYIVEIVSDDPEGAREILRRAMALRP